MNIIEELWIGCQIHLRWIEHTVQGLSGNSDPSAVMGWVELSWGGVSEPPCADPNPGGVTCLDPQKLT